MRSHHMANPCNRFGTHPFAPHSPRKMRSLRTSACTRGSGAHGLRKVHACAKGMRHAPVDRDSHRHRSGRLRRKRRRNIRSRVVVGQRKEDATGGDVMRKTSLGVRANRKKRWTANFTSVLICMDTYKERTLPSSASPFI